MIINMPKVGLSGRYTMSVKKPDGTVEKKADFDNLIVNSGLDALGVQSITTTMGYVQVGTGTSAPNVSQTALDSPVGLKEADTSTTTTSSGSAPWYTSFKATYTYEIGDVSGNLTEIGVFSNNDQSVMLSRALIKDENGDPTTITVLADEQLIVTYEIRVYPPTTDVTGTISADIKGVPTDIGYTIRAANVNDASAWGRYCLNDGGGLALEGATLGDITEYATFTDADSNDTRTTLDYIDGTFYRDTTTPFGISSANFANGITGLNYGIYGTILHAYATYQMVLDTPLMKTADDTLTVTFRFSWGRR